MKRQTSGAPDLTNKTESECSGLKSGVEWSGPEECPFQNWIWRWEKE